MKNGCFMEKNNTENKLFSTFTNLTETEKNVSNSVTAGSSFMETNVSIKDIKNDLPMYEILSLIGNGSTGMVYKAKHIKLERFAAVKMLRPEYFQNISLLESFRKEALILSRIKHENVASVYDFIEAGSRFYLIMELIDGVNLSNLCKTRTLSEQEILNILTGILEGIRFTHNKNILHLDLKPSNIIINERKEPVIIDFGVSRFKNSGSDDTQTPVYGTPYYMSPEQYTRNIDRVDFRSDLFSLGIIFYQLLTGLLPFVGKNYSDIRQKTLLENPLKPSNINSKISSDIEAIILKMLNKNPAYRYQDAQSVIDDIKRYLRGEPVKAKQYKFLTLLWHLIVRNPAISTLSSLVMVIVIIFSCYYGYQKYQQTPRWKKVFEENFNNEFKSKWTGYLGMLDGFISPIKQENFDKYFHNRIKVLSFKKDEDLVIVSSDTFDENIRLSFQINVNPESKSEFGFFVNAPDIANAEHSPEFGYIIYFKNNEIFLIRDNLSKTPLWNGTFLFKSDQIYKIYIEIEEGHVLLEINNKKIIDFQDFIAWFSKKEYRFGFFSKNTDFEVDNVLLYQQNTALLITPLSIGDRFYQLAKFEAAIEEYTRVINKYPENKIYLLAHYSKGLALGRLNRYAEAIREFEFLINSHVSKSLEGKSYYQKGFCELYFGKYKRACESFSKSIQSYDIQSLRSIISTTLINYCRETLNNASNKNTVYEIETLFQYLLNMNFLSRISFVDIPKKILLYHFENKDFEKSIKTSDILIKSYSERKGVVAFALYKKGSAYAEMAKVTKSPTDKNNYIDSAIKSFQSVFDECPEEKFYNYYSLEELASLYRFMGNYELSTECENKKLKYQDIFS